jgi:CubicO group peptidase (beta-lactamase class C family)
MLADIALQRSLQSVLDELVADADEVGLQAAVIKDGALVADAQSGVADPASGAPVSAGTLFFAGSTAKGVLSSLVHVLVAAGRLDMTCVSPRCGPSLRRIGKGKVTVRHVLMHQAGVPGLPPDLTTEQRCDWDHMCTRRRGGAVVVAGDRVRLPRPDFSASCSVKRSSGRPAHASPPFFSKHRPSR